MYESFSFFISSLTSDISVLFYFGYSLVGIYLSLIVIFNLLFPNHNDGAFFHGLDYKSSLMSCHERLVSFPSCIQSHVLGFTIWILKSYASLLVMKRGQMPWIPSL
jgi:hypothetical protein